MQETSAHYADTASTARRVTTTFYRIFLVGHHAGCRRLAALKQPFIGLQGTLRLVGNWPSKREVWLKHQRALLTSRCGILQSKRPQQNRWIVVAPSKIFSPLCVFQHDQMKPATHPSLSQPAQNFPQLRPRPKVRLERYQR